MTRDEARDMMLKDALETAIRSEKEIILLKRCMLVLSAVGCVSAACVAFLRHRCR